MPGAAKKSGPTPFRDDTPFLWHHDLHSDVAEETLYFLFVHTTPYNQTALLRNICDTCIEHSVRSFAVWELFGERDVLIRFWLPNQERIWRFEESLKSKDTNNYMFSADKFMVESFECHSDLQSLEAARSTAQMIEHKDLLRPTSQISSAQRKNYVGHGLGTLTGHHRSTLKVFIAIQVPGALTDGQTKATLDVYRTVLADPDLSGVGLFRGTGGIGTFFVSARVARSKMEVISQRILPGLQNQLPVYSARSISYVASLSRPLVRREQLLPDQPDFGKRFGPKAIPTQKDVINLLRADEGDHLEVKGTAFTDLDSLLPHSESARKQGSTVMPIAKAAVAFLNTGGGTIIIGALEERRYEFDDVKGRFAEASRIGEYILIGIQNEYRGGQWDDYERRLSQMLSARVIVAGERWMRISRVRVGANEVCVVEVQPGPRAFYTPDEKGDEVYFMRIGGRSEPVTGRKLEAQLRARGITRD